MQQLEMFLLFDEKSFRRLVKDVETCTTHTRLDDPLRKGIVVHSALHVLVPTKTYPNQQIMTVVRRVVTPSPEAAETEVRNAAEIMAREVKALVEFKSEFSVVSYMDDEGVPIPVAEEVYQVDRPRLELPHVEKDGGSLILNCIREDE